MAAKTKVMDKIKCKYSAIVEKVVDIAITGIFFLLRPVNYSDPIELRHIAQLSKNCLTLFGFKRIFDTLGNISY